jgi:hypothetical protein
MDRLIGLWETFVAFSGWWVIDLLILFIGICLKGTSMIVNRPSPLVHVDGICEKAFLIIHFCLDS